MEHDLQQNNPLNNERVWLKNYPEGVPAEINPDAYQSIVEVFEQSCMQFADRPAFYNLGTTITYAELDSYSKAFATYLQQELKLKKGDRIAIMLPNVLQYPIALFGALRAGLVVVNTNPLYTKDELTYQLNNAGVSTILVLENFAHTVEKALPSVPTLKHVIVTRIGDMLSPIKGFMIHVVLKYIRKVIKPWNIPTAIKFKDVLKEGSSLPLIPVEIHNQDLAFLQYTGGTTGVSKGAMLTHRNIIANLQQADAWFGSFVTKNEIIITALPLYHIFSLTANCIYFSKIGGLNVLITNPRDIPGMIKEMGKFDFTAFTGVNTLFNGLLKNPAFAKLNFRHLHLTLGGGMAVQEVVANEWQKVTGAPLLEAYGLTETSPCVTINPYTLRAYNGTIGLPVSSTFVCTVDDDGKQLPLGETGEIAIKGPQVMLGYWQSPEETKRIFTKDGWLLTGDIGVVSEGGFVKLLERKKDMILVSGFNVYPNEVENVIAAIPGVRECAVVGVHDDNSGEQVKAFIVSDNPDLTKAEVVKYCREHLTPYKVPKDVEFRSELPKTNVGKILRRALRDNQA